MTAGPVISVRWPLPNGGTVEVGLIFHEEGRGYWRYEPAAAAGTAVAHGAPRAVVEAESDPNLRRLKRRRGHAPVPCKFWEFLR